MDSFALVGEMYGYWGLVFYLISEHSAKQNKNMGHRQPNSHELPLGCVQAARGRVVSSLLRCTNGLTGPIARDSLDKKKRTETKKKKRDRTDISYMFAIIFILFTRTSICAFTGNEPCHERELGIGAYRCSGWRATKQMQCACAIYAGNL